MQQPQIAADFQQVGCARLQDAGHLDKRIGVGGLIHQVFTATQAESCHLAQFISRQKYIVARRRQTGSDRRAAQIDDPQPFLALERPPAIPGERLRECAELGAQGQGNSLHLFGSADGWSR